MSKKLQIACASILSGTILIGCGEGTTGVSTPATLKVISSDPSNIPGASTKVGIDKIITITFADALDPASVSEQSIMLMPGKSSAMTMTGMENMDAGGTVDHSQMMDNANIAVVTGKVECVNDQTGNCTTVKITPNMTMENGQQYHIMVHGLKTKSGRLFTGDAVVPLEFSTVSTAVIESERDIDKKISDPSKYRKSTYTNKLDPTTGRPVRDTRIDTDSTGATQLTKYNIPIGGGGRVGDVRYAKGDTTGATIERYTYRLMEGGKEVATVTFSGPGVDTQWGTADDVTKSFSTRGEDHGAHRLNTSYRSEVDTAFPTLNLNALKASTNFRVSGANLMVYNVTPGKQRMLKSIRFKDFGINNKLDIDMSGNKMPGFDDTVLQYQVYEYDPVHLTRIGRKEYGSDANNSNLTFDENTDIISGYRIYRTASATLGNAAGMLRVAEVTYSSPGADQNWGNIAGATTAQDDNDVKEYELNFYCRDQISGIYEKYEIEADPGVDKKIGNGSTITAYLTASESILLNACNIAKPDQSSLGSILGLAGDTLKDVDTFQTY